MNENGNGIHELATDKKKKSGPHNLKNQIVGLIIILLGLVWCVFLPVVGILYMLGWMD